ncbi:response regulator [Desulfovibrio oxamicus]|uniref:Response regulator n=1 Tax=Nitratidesulfovibrio oxamicus TaxID=32016 RepID=A0ABS0J6J8_9BACT|nr:response regulator [Nitratidesulfovibrio oxamicus]MBG3878093.1 response regulator [Nitratidesulfovibrio oxamicus]
MTTAIDHSLPPATVLIVDDAAPNRALLLLLLRDTPLRCMEADSGHAALRIFREHPVDLVLMDVVMPDMDGTDTVRAMREEERLLGRAPVPIVALTAHDRHEDLLRCADAGCNGLLTKPITRQDLMDTIAAHLAG